MLFAVSIENVMDFWENISFSIIYSECENEDEKIFKEEKSVEIPKILGLIKII